MISHVLTCLAFDDSVDLSTANTKHLCNLVVAVRTAVFMLEGFHLFTHYIFSIYHRELWVPRCWNDFWSYLVLDLYQMS